MEPTNPTKPPRRRFEWPETLENPWRLAAILLAVLYAAILFFGLAWSRCFFTTCPNVAGLAAFQPGGAPVLLDRHGEAFADLAPAEREIAPLSSLPSLVPQAFLAVEDQRFYEHSGVDWRRVGGAVFANLRAGGFAQGFSTISMQLARNVFPERIPGEQQTTRRKLLEIRVAQEIERRYSKEAILELYLNNIYFGNRAKGIEAASRQYFGHPASALTLPEAALLAGLPKAPTHYDPRRHPDEALARRNLVLALMRDQGRVPHALAEAALRQPLGIVAAPPEVRTEAGLAPYFVEQVRHELEERFGPNLYTRPLRIVTTLDSAAQRAAEEELRRQLKAVEAGSLGRFQGARYTSGADLHQGGTSYLQGAAVMLDAHDGDVLAWVGGRDFAQSQFDRVVQARRQPGSAFKPFVYAAALADGWVLSQPLLDSPLQVRMPNGQLWQPKNFSDRYDGPITMRDALVRSKNVATVRLADAVGLPRVVAAAHKAGIPETIAPVPSLALGTVAVSPLELTTAYTGFATLGQAAEPRLVLRVEDEKGKVLWKSEPRRHPVVDPGVAFLITDVLAEALVSGTGKLIQQTGLKAPAAGKTGTTNEGADAWFVGYTPEIVAGVWIGFDHPRTILDAATGGNLAAPVWGRMLARVYQGRPVPGPWRSPAGVIPHWVDPPTGLVISDGCAPQRGFAAKELFLKGKEPLSYCPGQEAPPAHGFPTERGLFQRDDAARRQAGQLAEQQRQAQEEQRQKAAAASATAATADKERALQEREARIASEEAAVAQREKEVAAREAMRRDSARDQRVQQAEARAALRIARSEAPPSARRPSAPIPPPQQAPADGEATSMPFEESNPDAPDLSGWWEVTNTIQSTNHPAYQGLRLTYRVQLEQDGNRITGRGQKWAEDGGPVSAAARSPISIVGRLAGRQVILEFTEQGARRATNGSFSWIVSSGALHGSFTSTAAATSGGSVARRMR